MEILFTVSPFSSPQKAHTKQKSYSGECANGKQQQRKAIKKKKKSPTPNQSRESTRPAPPPMHPGRERQRRVHSRGRSPPGPRWPGSSCARCGAFLPGAHPCALVWGTQGGSQGGGVGEGNRRSQGGLSAPGWVHKERGGVCRGRRVKTRPGGGGRYVHIRKGDSKEPLNPR